MQLHVIRTPAELVQTLVSSGRIFYKADFLAGSAGDGRTANDPAVAQAPAAEANLVSSRQGLPDEDGVSWHLPTLDLDGPPPDKVVRAIGALLGDPINSHEWWATPSTTLGHHHLFIERPLSWPTYRELLADLGDLQILQKGYVSASIARGATFVRKPGVTK